MKTVYIYGLSDPRDRMVHYVGHTIDIDQRLLGHLKDAAITPKTQWIAELQSVGLQPTLIVLDVVDYTERFNDEYRWIYLGRERGWPLTNTAAMKTEKYIEIANDAKSRIFVELDKGLTIGRICQLVFSFSDLSKDDRDKAHRAFSSFITFLCIAITIMMVRDWNININLLSVLTVIGAVISIAGLISMFLYTVVETRNRKAKEAKVINHGAIVASRTMVENEYNKEFRRLFPGSDVCFKIDENNKLINITKVVSE